MMKSLISLCYNKIKNYLSKVIKRMKIQVTEEEKIIEILKTILLQDLCAKNMCA